jgi:hypothetical protein
MIWILLKGFVSLIHYETERDKNRSEGCNN